jgi:hypothetical protein
LLDDPAAMEDVETVGDLADHGEVVGDEQVAQADLLAQLSEQIEDLCLHGHVERRHGLVADEDPRPESQRAGDRDALPLTAGES